VAITLESLLNGAVGFIDWLDGWRGRDLSLWTLSDNGDT
jgi:hypothetical protein